ncbi:SDR family NAD(P)-dependent oxidoreductase, partial [Bradyrhizobium sp. Leaf401]|uniref:SDR family NAD(P)-dependent oxidoreductase n=1 Tax=Bradyrhizobium sp. Leaf401 TaxID=2876564 RepID=UPI001E3FEDF9
ALDELAIVRAPSGRLLWSYARLSAENHAASAVLKVDIDICDEAGQVCVRLRGLVSREMTARVPSNRNANNLEHPVGALTLGIEWDVSHEKENHISKGPKQQIVLFGAGEQEPDDLLRLGARIKTFKIERNEQVEMLAAQLERLPAIDQLIWIAPRPTANPSHSPDFTDAQERGVLNILKIAKALLRAGYGTKELEWTIITTQTQSVLKKERIDPEYAGVHGLVGSIAKEHRNWKVRCVDLEIGRVTPIGEILDLPASHKSQIWAQRNSSWYRHKLLPIDFSESNVGAFRTGGVYLIIGGAGGVGETFTEYLIRNYRARVVWIGRREKDEAIQAKIDQLDTLGLHPDYISADASDVRSLQQAYEQIKTKHGDIHGVVHSAMSFSEKGIGEIAEDELGQAISAKLGVSLSLAQVFKDEPLDFVLFFSSLISLIKNPRQGAYAAGCAVNDAFARALAAQWPCQIKIINWGYWGIGASTEDEKLIGALGIAFIDPAEAMAAIERLLQAPMHQIGFMNTAKPIPIEGLEASERIVVYPILYSSFMGESLVLDRKEAKGFTTSQSSNDDIVEADQIAGEILVRQLQTLGVDFQRLADRIDLHAWAGLPTFCRHWLNEVGDMVTRRHDLDSRRSNGEDLGYSSIRIEHLWERWFRHKARWAGQSEVAAKLLFVEGILKALPDLLFGRGWGFFQSAGGFYVPHSLAESQLSTNLLSFVQERLRQDATARIRILEVGAGTGGTSARIFARLAPYREHIEEYCYTDLSQASLQHAQAAYEPDAPYLTTRIFNLDKPFLGQGLAAGSYDIVVAANVVHATRNIRLSLRQLKTALRNNGLLLLGAAESIGSNGDMVLELLEGWWLYEGEALREPGCPGLSSRSWCRVLEQEGY